MPARRLWQEARNARFRSHFRPPPRAPKRVPSPLLLPRCHRPSWCRCRAPDTTSQRASPDRPHRLYPAEKQPLTPSPSLPAQTSRHLSVSIALRCRSTHPAALTRRRLRWPPTLPGPRSCRLPPRRPPRRPSAPADCSGAAPIVLACGALLLWPLARRRRRLWILLILLVIPALAGGLGCSGSGGGGGGSVQKNGNTTSGTYSVSAVVTSNGVQHKVLLTLVVD